MKIESLNHFQVAAPRELIELVRDFYVQTLGFTEGPRPGFSSDGYWLYAGEKPLVHLRVEESPQVGRVDASHSYCDHIALSCVGLDEFETRLASSNVAFTKNHVKDLNQYQLFFRDPAGVGVELNFQL